MRIVVLFVTVVVMMLAVSDARTEDRRPNFIIIFADDLGYGDLSAYGAPNIDTPRLDQMAAEGMLFTSFYAAPVCGPSRAALMTGSYAPRASLAFNHTPNARTGIHSDEITIAEVAKQAGYRTMHIGKWHLGDHPDFLPLRHGFDEYFGLPYSNDMWPFHPWASESENEDPRLMRARERAAYSMPPGVSDRRYDPGQGFRDPLPLIRNDKVIETNPDQAHLTKRYTSEALRFIEENKGVPFFLYLAHTMPHVPLYASEDFVGVSERGLYGDTVEEIDWSTGRILDRLKVLGLDEHTLVVFTSDNGPWLRYGIDAGSAGPLRGGKNTGLDLIYEGGIRVPGIFRWPGHIPAGQRSSAIATTMGLLPTFAGLTEVELPSEHVIDGRDLWPLLSGADEESPHQAFYYFGVSHNAYSRDSNAEVRPRLQAVRKGKWKLHFEETDPGVLIGIELYDLSGDVGESRNRLVDHPDIVNSLQNEAKAYLDVFVENVRPLGLVGE